MRRDRDFRNLLIDTLDGIRELYKTRDIVNDIEASNMLTNSVNFLEDLLTPYMYNREYKPKQTDNQLTDIHQRIRSMILIARDVALMPPEEIIEDVSEWTIPTDDMESVEQAK